ncbi:response regulator transcription factor [Hymenobacter persicinus]|uniref:Response regulator transcription factor n=1 Tax=Hymenobacter persicinus TaxID=2025506 RepID=A0A4V1ZAT3_9BACT|nr:response regulator transcription factor [Hymenobacter persicinus]RYU79912.1 response regulator transcription factor [Hymenobacter persicinus]
MTSSFLPPTGVILVADAVPLLRLGLVQVLTQASAGYCLHQAATWPELLALTQQLAPALVVTSPDLPGAPAKPEALLTTLRATNPQLPVVVLTEPAATPESCLLRLLRHNVSGLLARSASTAEVCEMVAGVLRQGQFYSASMLALLQRQLERRTRGTSPKTEFTPRQLAVLQLIAEDYCNEEIAELLSTSVRTVEYHRSRMLQQTGTRTSLALVLFALRRGLFANSGLSVLEPA